jgi:hypothetical protein
MIRAFEPYFWRRTLTTQQTHASGYPPARTSAEGLDIDNKARDTYRALRDGGFSDADVMAFAGELLSLVASDVRSALAAE